MTFCHVILSFFRSQALLRKQDDQLLDVGQSVGVLKSIGVRIDNELEEQSV